MFEFNFEWDPAKAASNARKHGVTFDDAITVFQDPLMRSIADQEHGDLEQRWITLGKDQNERLLVVIHTYREVDDGSSIVRIISARPATSRERRDFEVSR